MATKARMTSTQISILDFMHKTVEPDQWLLIRDFAPIATTTKDVNRWARHPLLGLLDHGLVETAPGAKNNGDARWRITMKGVEALLEARGQEVSVAVAAEA